MDKSELDKILELHKKWMDDDPNGQRANLRDADLRYANLRNANLRDADLRDADLRYADLRDADLRYTHLRYANLRNASLRDADLRYANLCNADLRNADLDYSCFPLWCGGLSIHLDDSQIKQLLYHTVQNALYSKNTSDRVKTVLGQQDIIDLANEFHRADECGKLGGITK